MATLSNILKEVSVGKESEDIQSKKESPSSGSVVWIKECPYERVVVYQDRAEVIRNVQVTVREGENEITLVGLSQVIDEDSIRVEVESTQVAISDVVYLEQFEVEMKEMGQSGEGEKGGEERGGGETEDLRAAVKGLKGEERLLKKKVEVLKRTQNMLEKFGCMLNKGRTSELKKEGEQPVPQLKELVETDRLNSILKFSDFYLDRQNKYITQIAQLNKQLTALREKLTVLELNLSKRGDTAAAATATKSAKSNTTFQKAVKITFEGVSGVSDKSVSLSVSYLISNASWEPLYHVRVSVPEVKTEDAKSLIQIHYSGIIKQSSGEDWKSTKISFSTATPSKGGAPQPLETNSLRVYRPHVFRKSARRMKKTYMPTMMVTFGAAESFDNECSDPFGEPMHEVEEQKVSLHSNQFIQRFDTTRPANIPSDGTEHKVSITVISLEPVLEHVCVPEMSEHCYLTARVKNNTDYPLLAGASSIFLNNNFIAKSKVGNVAPTEELVVSLGADPQVRVKYRPGEAVTDTQEGWNSSSKQLTYNTLTTIKNVKRDPITFILRISLPISEEKKISVNLRQPTCKETGKPVRVESGTAEITSKNFVQWKIGIKPGTNHRVSMLYDVTS